MGMESHGGVPQLIFGVFLVKGIEDDLRIVFDDSVTHTEVLSVEGRLEGSGSLFELLNPLEPRFAQNVGLNLHRDVGLCGVRAGRGADRIVVEGAADVEVASSVGDQPFLVDLRPCLEEDQRARHLDLTTAVQDEILVAVEADVISHSLSFFDYRKGDPSEFKASLTESILLPKTWTLLLPASLPTPNSSKAVQIHPRALSFIFRSNPEVLLHQ